MENMWKTLLLLGWIKNNNLGITGLVTTPQLKPNLSTIYSLLSTLSTLTTNKPPSLIKNYLQPRKRLIFSTPPIITTKYGK